MKHGDVVFRFLFPAHENATEAVHPTMGSLHDPSARFESSATLEQCGLLTTRTNMSGESELLGQFTHLIIIIPFVQRQMLRLVPTGPWPSDRDTLEGLTRQLEVVDVGARCGQSHRYSPAFDQQASLRAAFGSIRGIGAGFSPHPEEPWSSRRPYSARTSPVLAVRHTPPVRFATVSEIRRRRTILENADEPSNWSKYRWRSRHSTGSRCARRRRSRPGRHGHSAEADHLRTGECSDDPATVPPRKPIAHRRSAIDHLLSSRTSCTCLLGLQAQKYYRQIRGYWDRLLLYRAADSPRPSLD